MKRTLLLMRHAKSDWNDSSLPDFERPLNSRGRKTAPVMGQWLIQHDLVPDLILSSTACRARQTTELVQESIEYKGSTQWLETLYHAPPSVLIDAIEHADPQSHCLLLVAHNPGLDALVSMLGESSLSMPTAAIAWFEFEADSWKINPRPNHFRFIEIARPKEM